MSSIPPAIAAFLDGDVLAVAGVSRDPAQFSNIIYRRLKETGHRVYAINPNADTVEGEQAYAGPGSIPEPVHGLLLCTPPRESASVVRAATAAGVRHLWFHRSMGQGSVSGEAIEAARTAGIEPIVGGCPMMFAGKVDVAHRCMKWILQRTGKVPR